MVTLFFSDSSQNWWIQVGFFFDNEHGAPTLDDFTPFEIASPPPLNLSAFRLPHWMPSFPVEERKSAFITRVLSDFTSEWRYVPRRTYADATFRELARATLNIAVIYKKTCVPSLSGQRREAQTPSEFTSLTYCRINCAMTC